MAFAQLLRRLEFDFVPHGLRSSFRDWAAEQTDARHDVVENALAHAVGNATEAAYLRSDLLELRRMLMEEWGEFLEEGRQLMSWINRQELLMKASMGPRHQTQVDLGNLGKIRFLEAYMNPGDELLAPEKLGRRIDDGLVESIWFELLRLEGDATRTEAFESTMDTIEKGIPAHPALFAFKMSLWEEKEGEVPPPSVKYLELARRHVRYGATRAPSAEEGRQIARVLLAPFMNKTLWETDWDRKILVSIRTDSWLRSRDLPELQFYIQASERSPVAWDTLKAICQQLVAKGEEDIPRELLEWHFWVSHSASQRPADDPAESHRPEESWVTCSGTMRFDTWSICWPKWVCRRLTAAAPWRKRSVLRRSASSESAGSPIRQFSTWGRRR